MRILSPGRGGCGPGRSGPGDVPARIYQSPTRGRRSDLDPLRWNRLRWSAIAPLYDALVRLREPRRRALEWLAPAPGSSLLVVGCGTGADLPFIPPGVEVTAVDLTPAMVGRTRSRARTLRREVRVEVMDAQALGFADATFDHLLLHLVVAVVPDPCACLREAGRVLRPGGTATLLDKVVPEGRTPSLLRRVLNPLARFVATDLTVQLGPLLPGTGLRMIGEEPAALGGFFRTVLLEREDTPVAAGETERPVHP